MKIKNNTLQPIFIKYVNSCRNIKTLEIFSGEEKLIGISGLKLFCDINDTIISINSSFGSATIDITYESVPSPTEGNVTLAVVRYEEHREVKTYGDLFYTVPEDDSDTYVILNKKEQPMSEEELLKKFIDITGIDPKFIDDYARITSVTASGNIVCNGFEGIGVNVNFHGYRIPLTYLRDIDRKVPEGDTKCTMQSE